MPVAVSSMSPVFDNVYNKYHASTLQLLTLTSNIISMQSNTSTKKIGTTNRFGGFQQARRNETKANNSEKIPDYHLATFTYGIRGRTAASVAAAGAEKVFAEKISRAVTDRK